jgi:integrase/recombinase XerD
LTEAGDPTLLDELTQALASPSKSKEPQIPAPKPPAKPHRLGIGGRAALLGVPATALGSLERYLGYVELQGLAERTVESYVAKVRALARWAGEDPALLTEARVTQFVLYCKRELKYAPQSIRLVRVSLGCFYNGMMESGWRVFANIHAKDEQKLPVVLTREEVRRLLAAVRQPRFGVCLRLIYECGLRLGEGLAVEVSCINRAAGLLHVKLGKGAKDRMVPLSPDMLDQLSWWWRQHKNPRFLFPSIGLANKRGHRMQASHRWQCQQAMMKVAETPLGESSLQQAFQKAAQECGFAKRATIHTLRHSYATHLLEEGLNIRLISQYLGHANLEQTLVYTHLTAVTDAQTQVALARLSGGLPAFQSPF